MKSSKDAHSYTYCCPIIMTLRLSTSQQFWIWNKEFNSATSVPAEQQQYVLKIQKSAYLLMNGFFTSSAILPNHFSSTFFQCTVFSRDWLCFFTIELFLAKILRGPNFLIGLMKKNSTLSLNYLVSMCQSFILRYILV